MTRPGDRRPLPPRPSVARAMPPAWALGSSASWYARAGAAFGQTQHPVGVGRLHLADGIAREGDGRIVRDAPAWSIPREMEPDPKSPREDEKKRDRGKKAAPGDAELGKQATSPSLEIRQRAQEQRAMAL